MVDRGDLTGESLSGAALVARNAAANLGTRVLLGALSIALVPFMVRAFGMELYGVLMATWMVLAQAGGITTGFGRAAARRVTESLARGDADPGLWTATALLMQAALGAVAAVAIWQAGPSVVRLLDVAPEHRGVALDTVRMIALAVPLNQGYWAVRRTLEAAQRFGWVNGLVMLGRVCTYGIYTLGIVRGGDLRLVVAGLAALQALQLGIGYAIAASFLPTLRSASSLPKLARELWPRARALLSFGGWSSISSTARKISFNIDRWVVAAVAGAAVLPLYAVPHDLLWRMRILPKACADTLFPAFTAMHAGSGRERMADYFVRAHRYILLLLVPVIFVLFAWSYEVLRLWIGPDFAARAALPFRVLLVGFAARLLAPVSRALLDGVDRPDWEAKIYLLELPVWIGLLWVLTNAYGVVGAAVAFTLTAFAHTAALWFVVDRGCRISYRRMIGDALHPAGSILAVLVGGAALLPRASIGEPVHVTATVLACAVYAVFAAILVLDDRDRDLVGRLLWWPALAADEHDQEPDA